MYYNYMFGVVKPYISKFFDRFFNGMGFGFGMGVAFSSQKYIR